MDMVRRGLMFSFREASCWRVLVMKGGAGARFLSCRLMLLTVKGASWMSARIWSTSSLECSSIFFSRP